MRFDLEKGFTNYDGDSLGEHAHEAAYDAYMTGFAFVHILKFKEISKVLSSEREAKDKIR